MEIRYDVNDTAGPGSVRVDVTRYLFPEWATPRTAAMTFDCLTAQIQNAPWRGNVPGLSVQRLPDGATAVISDCVILAGTRGCSQVVYGTTGLRVEVGAYLFAFSTDTGGELPPLTRTTMPLTTDQMLHLAQAIEALR